ncbi:cation:proton antiporter [Pengzhenrongella sp.]|uniref:cation:proton antiporter domain-containing protein n=1 Tax=Pengzhenrongella sp. TaxID=2888820 RepID=UPI0039C956FC
MVEIMVGAVVADPSGHEHLVYQTPITGLLAMLGSAVLAFLAGAEIDPISLRKHWKPSVTIGQASFLAPFAEAFAFSLHVLGRDLHAAEICWMALDSGLVTSRPQGRGRCSLSPGPSGRCCWPLRRDWSPRQAMPSFKVCIPPGLAEPKATQILPRDGATPHRVRERSGGWLSMRRQGARSGR